MFQFTREFIINDNEGKLNGKRFVGKNGILQVDRICNLYGKNVVSAWMTKGKESQDEVVTVTPGTVDVEKGDVVRLVIVLGQEGRVISTYNDAYPEHTRTFMYEAKVAEDGKLPLEALANAAKHENDLGGEVFFTLTDNHDDSDPSNPVAATTLTIAAPDEYTRVQEVRVVKVPSKPDDKTTGAILTGYHDYEEVLVAVRRGSKFKDAQGADSTVVVLGPEGSLGVGTTNHILHDLRLQTAANITPYGINMDERPYPNATYTQFTLEYVTERRHIGSQVFGSIDHSLATYIFFVRDSKTECNTDNIADQFKDALIDAGITVTETNQDLTVATDNDLIAAVTDVGGVAPEDVIKPRVVTGSTSEDVKGKTQHKKEAQVSE